MIEKKILSKSKYVFLYGCVIVAVFAVVTKKYTLLTGFMLGYGINLIAFRITVAFTDMILSLQDNTARLSSMMFILKIGVYASGLLLAIKLPMIFHFATVAMGYFLIKITIYIDTFRHKGGDEGA